MPSGIRCQFPRVRVSRIEPSPPSHPVVLTCLSGNTRHVFPLIFWSRESRLPSRDSMFGLNYHPADFPRSRSFPEQIASISVGQEDSVADGRGCPR